MRICGDISSVFPDLKIVDISDYYSVEIAEAKDIYQCHPPWENVPSSNLGKKKSRKRAMLNTAKIVCDKLATLTFSEQCDINIENEQTKEYVMQVLEDNLNCGVQYANNLKVAHVEGLTIINSSDFPNKTNLTIYVSTTLQKISYSAFQNSIVTIEYSGTQEQWDSIEKVVNWDNGATITLHCNG